MKLKAEQRGNRNHHCTEEVIKQIRLEVKENAPDDLGSLWTSMYQANGTTVYRRITFKAINHLPAW